MAQTTLDDFGTVNEKQKPVLITDGFINNELFSQLTPEDVEFLLATSSLPLFPQYIKVKDIHYHDVSAKLVNEKVFDKENYIYKTSGTPKLKTNSQFYDVWVKYSGPLSFEQIQYLRVRGTGYDGVGFQCRLYRSGFAFENNPNNPDDKKGKFVKLDTEQVNDLKKRHYNEDSALFV